MNMKIVISLTFFLLTCTISAFGQVVVIANKSVPLDTLGKTDLLDFYTGDIRRWSDKRPVVVLDLKPKNEARKIFYKFLGKSSSRMKSIWLKNMLSGEGEPPKAMNSEEEMLKIVLETAGAIGFISKNNVVPEVKVLALVE